jgi:ATP-dependent Lon protease
LLTIEVAAVPGSGKLNLTGQLGEVMKESAQAALTYLRAHSREYGLPEDFHNKVDLHIHVPDGATPKDGPSAGITMATAIASALSRRPARMDIAMTRRGQPARQVMPIGGVKEKLLLPTRLVFTRLYCPRTTNPSSRNCPRKC